MRDVMRHRVAGDDVLKNFEILMFTSKTLVMLGDINTIVDAWLIVLTLQITRDIIASYGY